MNCTIILQLHTSCTW